MIIKFLTQTSRISVNKKILQTYKYIFAVSMLVFYKMFWNENMQKYLRNVTYMHWKWAVITNADNFILN